MISICTKAGYVHMPVPAADCGTAVMAQCDHGAELLTEDCVKCEQETCETYECQHCGELCDRLVTVIDEDRSVGYYDEIQVCVNCAEGGRS